MRRAVVVAAGCGLALLPSAARAFETDRLAVEVLAGESPRDAAIAFEKACWRLGIAFESADPVRVIASGGQHFVRLRAAGDSSLIRCLQGLDAPRHALDGTISWENDAKAALLLPITDPPTQVPGDEFEAAGVEIPAGVANEAVADKICAAAPETTALAALGIDDALATLRVALRRPHGPSDEALFAIARTDPRPRLRRQALDALPAGFDVARLAVVAGTDPAWEVRQLAVERLARDASVPSPSQPEFGPSNITAIFADRLSQDHDWEVRRSLVLALAGPLGDASGQVLLRTAENDVHPRVRALALEVLAEGGLVGRPQLLARLRDADEEVRAIAVRALITVMQPQDAPAIWSLMQDPSRLVRIGAAPVLDRVDDDSVSQIVWVLYLQESSETDPDPELTGALLRYVARHPFEALAPMTERRLLVPGDGDQRRGLARLLAKVDPARAATTLVPWLSSKDPVERALAAEAAPNTPATLERRKALLLDDDAGVRAAAVLGLCAPGGGGTAATVADVALEPIGPGREAAMIASRCGEAEPELPRWTVELRQDVETAPVMERPAYPGAIPAAIAIVLLLASVIAVKAAQAQPEPKQGPPAPPPPAA